MRVVSRVARWKATQYPPYHAVCRRAERHLVRLTESGEKIEPNILPYFNRLSDLLWLLGRVVEIRGGQP